jgi:hypothetical protein
MSFVDVIQCRKKIGSLVPHAVEYANRVPREIFTKDVAKSYLTFEFISAR